MSSCPLSPTFLVTREAPRSTPWRPVGRSNERPCLGRSVACAKQPGRRRTERKEFPCPKPSQHLDEHSDRYPQPSPAAWAPLLRMLLADPFLPQFRSRPLRPSNETDRIFHAECLQFVVSNTRMPNPYQKWKSIPEGFLLQRHGLSIYHPSTSPCRSTPASR